MRYVDSRCRQNDREETYRIYVTDALKAIGGFNARYLDVFGVEETRTSNEIITNISDKLKKLGES